MYVYVFQFTIGGVFLVEEFPHVNSFQPDGTADFDIRGTLFLLNSIFTSKLLRQSLRYTKN